MTLTSELTPTEEAQLTEADHHAVLAPDELARKLVTGHLAPVTLVPPEAPTLTPFAQWDADDAQMAPEDITEAQRDYEVCTQRMQC